MFFFNKLVALIILISLSPFLILFIFLVFINDFQNPIYISERMGVNFKKFKLYKIRSMIVGADKSGISSTSSSDNRITNIGKFIRKFKIDEFMQLINVIIGDMNIVGPRPQIESEVNLYTKVEKKMLFIKPGITDFSSIVFSDEADILINSIDPNKDYNLLIRPWKSRLALFYLDNKNLFVDFKIIYLTIISIFFRELALKKLANFLKKLNADPDLIDIASRHKTLQPHYPPF